MYIIPTLNHSKRFVIVWVAYIYIYIVTSAHRRDEVSTTFLETLLYVLRIYIYIYIVDERKTFSLKLNIYEYKTNTCERTPIVYCFSIKTIYTFSVLHIPTSYMPME